MTFGRKPYVKPERQMPVRSSVPLTSPVRMADARSIMRIPVEAPKGEPLQHAGYMALVRKLPCAVCGISGFTQFCHSDQGKGVALKTDCRLGWPGCGPHPDASGRMVPGCHYLVGSTGKWRKFDRRAFEAAASKNTRDAIRAAGLWPKRLPLWPGDAA